MAPLEERKITFVRKYFNLSEKDTFSAPTGHLPLIVSEIPGKGPGGQQPYLVISVRFLNGRTLIDHMVGGEWYFFQEKGRKA